MVKQTQSPFGNGYLLIECEDEFWIERNNTDKES